MWLGSVPEDVLPRKELQVGSCGNGLVIYSRASLVKDRTVLKFETSGLEESA